MASQSVSLPDALKRPVDVLMIDNFDSFTWNLYQQLSLLNVDVTVIRNDAIPSSSFPYLDIKRLIISPGPGHPKTDSGISGEAVRFFTGKVPILGVCMGLEVIVDVFGGEIGYAGEIKHGKLSPIRHDGRGLFSGLPQSFLSTRYHSLSASIKALPQDNSLQITAATEESGVIMGVRHRVFTIEAVQYHPESVLSEQGETLLKNFLGLRGGTWDENPHVRVKDMNLPPFPVDVPPPTHATAANGITNGTGVSSSPSASQAQVQAKMNTSKLPSILEKIHIQRLKDIEVARNTPGASLEDLETLLGMNVAPPCIDIVERLRSTSANSTTLAIMTEIKRASPSKGPIALRVNAAQQALSYALASSPSVAVISVLTEPTWFKGSLLDLSAARQAIAYLPHRPAILRKDFILSTYQIAEARVWGADAVLLIVSLLPSKEKLREMMEYSRKLGMEPLVEVNNEKEMDVALDVGAKVIGVNNRSLHTFEVDMRTTTRLAEMVRRREEVILCALSGISTPEEVRTYARQGVKAVLVGEALMRAQDPGEFVRYLLGVPAPAASASASEGETKRKDGESVSIEAEQNQQPLVKICGILTVDEALTAAQAGADMLGLNFVSHSKRYVSVEVACRIAHAIRERRMVGVVEGSEGVNSSGNEDTKEGHDDDDAEKKREEKGKENAGKGEDEGNLPWFASHAKRLSGTLQSRARPLLVGIFQDQSLSYILQIVAQVQLDMVQLHGREPLHYALYIPVPVVRAFHLGAAAGAAGAAKVKGLEEITRPGYHKFVLLDAVRDGGDASGEEGRGLSGGSGKVVDWELARAISDAGEVGPSPFSWVGAVNATPSKSSYHNKPSRLPIILAGGLTPANVADAVEKVRPWAVDVAGGVERERSSLSGDGGAPTGGQGGRKDLEKVIAFIRAAKGLSVESNAALDVEKEEDGHGLEQKQEQEQELKEEHGAAGSEEVTS